MFKSPPKASYKNTKLKLFKFMDPILNIEITISMNKAPNPNKLCIIYSHSNTETLDSISQNLEQIALSLNCMIFSYDYLGFGETNGTPTEQSIIAVANSVFVLVRQSFSENQILLWGRAIGSVPTIRIASQNEVEGCILECPMASAMRAVNLSSQMFGNMDGYDNTAFI